MSAAEAFKAARAAGVRVGIDGDDLALEASNAPPLAVLDAQERHCRAAAARKGAVEDWQAFFDERAGIIEFDGGLTRPQAEAQAFACCVAEWLIRNPECTDAVEALRREALMTPPLGFTQSRN